MPPINPAVLAAIAATNPYTGPTVPTQYVANWGSYTNLTGAQIAWFQSRPQDLLIYTLTRAGYYLAVNAASLTGPQALTYLTALTTAVRSIVNELAVAVPNITQRAQVDAALAAVPTGVSGPSI